MDARGPISLFRRAPLDAPGERQLRIHAPLNAFLLGIAVLTALAGNVMAAESHEHPTYCNLYPAIGSDGKMVMSLAKDYAGNAGSKTYDLTRSGLQDASNVRKESLGPRPETRAAATDPTGTWSLLLKGHASWITDISTVATSQTSDVVLAIDASVTADGRPLRTERREVTIRSGVAGPDGLDPFGANPFNPGPGEFIASFKFTHVYDRHEGPTLDRVGMGVAFQVLAPTIPDAPGDGKVVIRWIPFVPTTGGAILLVPGACNDADNSFPAGGGHDDGGHTHDEGHAHRSSGDCNSAVEACTPASSGTACGADACDSAGADVALANAALPEAAATTSPPSWGPAAVTAGLGIAGLACFRPRRP